MLEEGVDILIKVPHQGCLVEKLKQEIKDYAITARRTWFEIDLDYRLSALGDVLKFQLDRKKDARYSEMELDA